jgi:hypothetical protein
MSALHPKSNYGINQLSPINRPSVFFRPEVVARQEKTWKLLANQNAAVKQPTNEKSSKRNRKRMRKPEMVRDRV